ncbi:MAG: YncE family protein [Acidobacteria bacterium]|nr:YncE family protein [Acidobacteriota bacterium]
MKKVIYVACLTALLGVAVSSHAAESYRLIKKIPVDGVGQWDYIGIDVANRHVFVSHGPQLDILDADTYEHVGKIVAPGVDFSKPETLRGNGVRGGGAAPDLGRGFIPNALDGSMTLFDLKTLKVISIVKVGENPDGYVYDPATKRAFTFSNRTKGGMAVDIADAKLAGLIPLGSKPEAAAADGKGHVFVDMQETNMVAKIDSRKLVVEESWPTAPCEMPSSMAMDVKNNRLFLGCRGKSPMLAVMDASNGKIITTLPIGTGTDAAAFDVEKKLIFTSNGEGTISVIQQESADKYKVVETVKTEPGARTMTLDTKTHRLFLITADRTTPPATPENPNPAAVVTPGTFRVLVVAPQ